MTDVDSCYFHAGGTLSGKAPSYVKRRADETLFQALLADEFCYVLDTRQVGKSSLMVHVGDRLRERGRQAVHLDVSSLGNNLSPEQWYYGLLETLAAQFDLTDSVEAFWTGNPRLGYARRWFACLDRVILPALSAPLTVFVDEIDAVRKLPFCVDEFFALIRECHNRRAHQSDGVIVTFCLIGVALPSDLITDAQTTPFNIGRRVELSDFTLEETCSLSGGLYGTPKERIAQLRRAWYWTAGHPYLTQKLCREIAQTGKPLQLEEVDAVCRELFLEPRALGQEDNLQFVSKQLLNDKESVADILTLYDRIQATGRTAVPDSADALLSRLRLAGIVTTARTRSGNEACVRNRIYAAVFGRRWVADNMPGAELRRQKRAVRQGYLRASLVWSVVAVLALIASFASRRAIVEADGRQNAERRARQTEGLKRAAEANLGTVQVTLRTTERELAGKVRRSADLTRQISKNTTKLNETKRKLGATARQSNQRETQLRSFKAQYAHLAEEAGRAAGPVASAFASRKGQEQKAAHFALQGVQPFLDLHAHPSPEAMQGLADVASVGMYRYLQLIHPGGVASVAFDHGAFDPSRGILRYGGQRLLTAGDRAFVYVWSMSDGRLLQRIRVCSPKDRRQTVNAAFYSQDDHWIVTADDNGRVAVWDATKRAAVQERPRLSILTGSIHITATALTRDMRLLATTGPGHSALLWDMSTFWREAAMGDHEPIVWDYRTGGCRTITITTRPWPRDTYVWALAFSHNGNQLATGGEDRIVRVWDTATGKLISSYAGHDSGVRAGAIHGIAFSAWDTSIVSCGMDRSVQRWDVRGGFMQEYAGHTAAANDVSVEFNDLFLASASDDGTVRVWPFTTPLAPIYVLNTHAGRIWSVTMNFDPHLLASASADRTAEVWRFCLPIYTAMNGEATAVTFSPDGKNLTCASTDGMAHAWNWRINQPVFHLVPDSGVCRYAETDHHHRWMATAHDDGTVSLWHVGTYGVDHGDHTSPEHRLRGHMAKVNTASFSPDDRFLVTASTDGTAIIWDTATFKPLRTLTGHRGELRSAFFSPDGRQIVTAGLDRSVRLWDVATAVQTGLLLLPTRGLSSGTTPDDCPSMAAFSPDGSLVVSADRNHQSYVWRVSDGKLLSTLVGHTEAVKCAAFSPDGLWIATASADRTVRFWDASAARNGGMIEPYYDLHDHFSAVNWVSYSPDGDWLAVAGHDGTARVYPASLTAMLAKARELANNPTQERTAP